MHELNRDLLEVAIKHSRPVTFTYVKGDGKVIERRSLRPQAISLTKDGRLLVVGEDEDRDDTRAYRLNRIKGKVEVL